MEGTAPGAAVVVPQHATATIAPAHLRTPCRPLWSEQPPWGWQRPARRTMPTTQPRRIAIQGVTKDGRPFRPSDWAERLAGAMSSFRPEGSAGGIGAFIGYSPYCVPRVVDGVRSVIVDEALRGIEPMAWDFVTGFARDNDLVTRELDPGSDPT